MRLVFTKLETPLNYIEVDIGTGTFEEFSLEDLQDSETGKYIQLPDTISANSIRVKANSSELGSFDMIKEYQITDDEGNILGGSGDGGLEIKELPVYIKYSCHNYELVPAEDLDWETGRFIGYYSSDLYLLIDGEPYNFGNYIPGEVVYKIGDNPLSLRYTKDTAGSMVSYGYMPIPYKFKLLGEIQD